MVNPVKPHTILEKRVEKHDSREVKKKLLQMILPEKRMRPDHGNKHHGDKTNRPLSGPERCGNNLVAESDVGSTNKDHDITEYGKKHKPEGKLTDPQKIDGNTGKTEFVGKWIKNFSHFRNLVCPSSRPAVKPVRQNSHYHNDNSRLEMTGMKIVDKPGYQYYSQKTERIRQINDTTFHIQFCV